MPYPYKKMDENDFEAIRRFTDDSRVWVGDEIAREYYHDEMPNYGTYPPELYVEVLNKEEVSAILAYAYEKNIPVVCREPALVWREAPAVNSEGSCCLSCG